MTETRIVYRIENPIHMDGMWYTKDGIYRKTIHILCPNGISKTLPMPKNLELHRKDGFVWNSAGKNIESMHHWFTASDALSLYRNGFRLFQFEVNMFNELEFETLFCRDGIVKQKEIPLETIWDLTKEANHE